MRVQFRPSSNSDGRLVGLAGLGDQGPWLSLTAKTVARLLADWVVVGRSNGPEVSDLR
jgi:hypothetical protein